MSRHIPDETPSYGVNSSDPGQLLDLAADEVEKARRAHRTLTGRNAAVLAQFMSHLDVAIAALTEVRSKYSRSTP
jgi:hypothetical protein